MGPLGDTVWWVFQEDPLGCSIAAMAMLLGRKYQSVKADFPGIDFVTRSITLHEVDDYLASRGFASARRFRYIRGVPSPDWPPEPFGDLHLCLVLVAADSPCNHFVLMRSDGSVLDPLSPHPTRLSSYHAVHNIAAMVRLSSDF